MMILWLPQREGGNLGDDFQSVALYRFFAGSPQDYDVRWYERDSLRLDGEYNKADLNVMLLSGWYSHNRDWPVMPPDGFIPVFVGYHDCISVSAKDKLQRLAALAERSPLDIGCRDTLTCSAFVMAGVPRARIYPSWCATLTLHGAPVPPTRDKCLVINGPGGDWLQRIYAGEWIERTQCTAEDIITDRAARYRLAANRLLELYHARCVVTSRLHVGIPCAVFGTPVIVAASTRCADPRYADYAAMFHYDCYAGTAAVQPTLDELRAMQIGRERHIERMCKDAHVAFAQVRYTLEGMAAPEKA